MNETTIFPLGTQVRVSDGTPCPPARFNKKLRDWEGKNYDGVVTEYRPECGGYTVQTMPRGGWSLNAYFLMFRSGVPAHKVTAILDAAQLPVKGDGMNVQVDVSAMFSQGLKAA